MTPAEQAAYRALVPFGLKAVDRATIAAMTVASLAEVPAEFYYLGVDDPHGSWGVTADLSRRLPPAVQGARRGQVAAATVAAALGVLMETA